MTTEQDQSTTEDRPNKATSSTTDRPIASGDGRSASFAVSGPDSPATDDSNDSGPYIDDIAPRRTRDFGDLTRAGLSLLMAAVVMVFAVYLGGMTRGVESDAHTAAQAINWLAAFPSTVLTQLATTVIVVIVLAQLLLAREWLQAAVSALAMFAGYGIVWVISTAISSNRLSPPPERIARKNPRTDIKASTTYEVVLSSSARKVISRTDTAFMRIC